MQRKEASCVHFRRKEQEELLSSDALPSGCGCDTVWRKHPTARGLYGLRARHTNSDSKIFTDNLQIILFSNSDSWVTLVLFSSFSCLINLNHQLVVLQFCGSMSTDKIQFSSTNYFVFKCVSTADLTLAWCVCLDLVSPCFGQGNPYLGVGSPGLSLCLIDRGLEH